MLKKCLVGMVSCLLVLIIAVMASHVNRAVAQGVYTEIIFCRIGNDVFIVHNLLVCSGKRSLHWSDSMTRCH